MGKSIQNFTDWQKIKNKVWLYCLLARMDKPIGIFILLWPVLWSLWLASNGFPNTWVLLVFCLGVVVMRSAGCVINDYADRNIDPHVERTKLRPIASGKITSKEALLVFVVLCLFAFCLVLTLNAYSILLSFGGAFLAASYPFMKRYTHLPQAYLGIAFGWAVPMAFAAQTNNIPEEAWLLYLSVVLWALVYDTMYAMVDKEDDLKIGVKSTAILFGDSDRLIIGLLQICQLILLWVIGSITGLKWPYFLGLSIAACLSVYQQILIYGRDRDRCFKAFLNNNWYGMVIFLGLFFNYLY